jgi:RNase P subunit RPR2
VIPRGEVTPSKYQSPSECGEFQCEEGKEGYADFVKKEDEALKLYYQNTNVTYLFKLKEDVIGYVAIAMSSLPTKQLPEDLGRVHKYDHVPSLLLGQMARDIRFRGTGVGDHMIDFVVNKANGLAEEIGCRLVIVDSEPDTVACYERNGFERVSHVETDGKTKLYLDLWRPHTKCKRCGYIYQSTVKDRKDIGEGKLQITCPKCGEQSEYPTGEYYFN